MTYQLGKKGDVVFLREQGPWGVEYQEVVLKKYKKPLFAKKVVGAVVVKYGKALEVGVWDLFDAPKKFVFNQAVA
jgi:hypothetical protein